MKKNRKIKFLTTAACLALIGSASAAWVYSGTATASANIGVKVAAYASAGEITVSGADNLCVYLDNGSVTFKKIDESIPFTATYSKPTGYEDSSITPTLTYQVVICSDLNQVIKFGTDVTTISTSDSTVATDYSYSWESGVDITNLPELAYYVDNASTYLTNETHYKEWVGHLTGYIVDGENTSDYSWYDRNKEYTFDSKFYVTINFQVVVPSN